MKRKSLSLFGLCLPLLAHLSAAAAQPGVGRPAASQVGLVLDSAFTGTTAFEAQGAPAGGIAVTQFGARLSYPLPALDQKWFPAVGLRYQYYDLDRDPGTPLPDHLKSLGLSLSLAGSLATDWSFFGSVSPRVSNAGDGFSSHGIGFGLIAIATRKLHGDFSAGFGLVYDSLARGTGRLLPVATFDWSPAPAWRVFLGFPRTGVSWQIAADLKAEFVAEADFGSFYVTNDPLAAGGSRPALDHTRLEYQAVRVGPALTWNASPGRGIRLAIGAVPLLNAEYRRRNYKMESDDVAAFVSLEFNWHF